MSRLKIAIFEEACAGGSGRHVADLASNLAIQGHDVHLLYSHRHIDDRFREGLACLQEFRGHSEPIDVRHNVHPSDVRAMFQVEAYLARNGPFDIFHCHSTKAGLVGRLAALRLGVPAIYTPHAFLTMSPVCDRISFAGAYLIERALARSTEAIICVSEEEADHAERLGIPAEKIKIIPNGMPLVGAGKPKSLRQLVRNELGLADTDVCIGAVGRLVDQKAPQVFIEAFGLATAQLNRSVKLIVVGTGPLLSRLEELAKRLSISDRVSFRGELPGLRTMAAFDVFAASSCYEGHPYTFIEALSLGLPIVTTAIGGARASVINGVNGYISPVGDAKAMANSFIKLASSPALREEMSTASLRIIDRFTLDKMMSRTVLVYQDRMRTRRPMIQRAAAAG